MTDAITSLDRDRDKAMHKAFLEAYADLPNPVKNADNPAFKRDGKPMRYADLEATLDVMRPAFAAAGFAIVQQPVSVGDHIGVHTRFLWRDGGEIDFGEFTVPLAKSDPQGAGAALSYCRRYSLTAIGALAQADDDANAASTPRPPAATDNDAAEWKTLTDLAKVHGTDANVRAFFADKGISATLAHFRNLNDGQRADLRMTVKGD